MTCTFLRSLVVTIGIGLALSSAGAQTGIPLDPDQVEGDSPYRTLKGFKEIVTGVAFSPDGQSVVAVSYDGTIKLWNLEDGKATKSISLPKTKFYSVRFSPDGKTFATCENRNIARIWDAATLQQIGELSGHAGTVTRLAYAPDGSAVATCSRDRTIKIWDAHSRECQMTLASPSGGVPTIQFMPDGKTLAAARFDDPSTVSLLELKTGRTKSQFVHSDRQRFSQMAVSPDGKLLVVATRVTSETLDAARAAGEPIPNDQWSFLTFWDVETGQTVRTVPAVTKGHSRLSDAKQSFYVSSMAFLPDGSTLLTSGKHWIYLWDVSDGSQRKPIKAHPKVVQQLRWQRVFLLNPIFIRTVAVSPDGTKIAEGYGAHFMPEHKTVMPAVGPKTDRHPGWKARGEVNLWRLPLGSAAIVNAQPPIVEEKPDQPNPKENNEEKEPTPEEIERRAAGKLRLAVLLLKKKPEIARQRLREIVSDYPGTEAAEKAAAKLKEID